MRNSWGWDIRLVFFISFWMFFIIILVLCLGLFYHVSKYTLIFAPFFYSLSAIRDWISSRVSVSSIVVLSKDISFINQLSLTRQILHSSCRIISRKKERGWRMLLKLREMFCMRSLRGLYNFIRCCRLTTQEKWDAMLMPIYKPCISRDSLRASVFWICQMFMYRVMRLFRRTLVAWLSSFHTAWSNVLLLPSNRLLLFDWFQTGYNYIL